jgi:hypothetical protein
MEWSEMSDPEISVVIASLRSRDELEATESLSRCEFEDYELLVRDEAPVTKARNEGIKRASADKIVFLDDDSRVREEYLSRAADTLEKEMAYAGRTVHPRDDIFAEQFTGHYSAGDEPQYVDRFWGNNMGVRREVFETVGGWDENIGWGHEEKELASRVTEEFDIYYDPGLVVDHPYVDSLTDFWRKHYRLELQAAYCWDKEGLSDDQKLKRIVARATNPRGYLGRTPAITVARAGRTIMQTAGRIVGLVSFRTGNVAERGGKCGAVPDLATAKKE